MGRIVIIRIALIEIIDRKKRSKEQKIGLRANPNPICPPDLQKQAK